jgi:hypothetical protein
MTDATNTSVEIRGDWTAKLNQFYVQREKASTGGLAGRWIRPNLKKLDLELKLRNLATDDDQIVPLTNCAVPQVTRIASGTYAMSIVETGVGTILGESFHRIDGNEAVDLTRLRPLSKAEVDWILNPAEAVEFVEPVPELVRTARVASDHSSRLGIEIGTCTQNIKCSSEWIWSAFHVPYPAVVGRVESPIFLFDRRDTVQFRIFDAQGGLVLSTDLKFLDTGRVRSRVDEFKLTPGDYLIAFRVGGGGASSGSGEYPSNAASSLRACPRNHCWTT